jgi:hypothetical protein
VPLVWVLIAGDDGERESLGRTGTGAANVCVISNSDAGVAAAWRARTVCGLLGGPDPRERNVPSDASAARGGSETVPLVECALTVANASIASEVRRFARMEEEASGGTVRLVARLRGPMGEGGRVVVFVSVGCVSSACRIGQRCTRRRNPCQTNVRYMSASEMGRTCLDDAETGESTDIDTDTAHVVVLHPFEDCCSWSHARVQVKQLRPVRDCPAWIRRGVGVSCAARSQVKVPYPP